MAPAMPARRTHTRPVRLWGLPLLVTGFFTSGVPACRLYRGAARLTPTDLRFLEQLAMPIPCEIASPGLAFVEKPSLVQLRDAS